ncbi:MAG: site-specific integrase, partial [Planctomycetota bacterium]
ANGQWCKKIRGTIHYFGPWSDPDGARDRYLTRAEALHAGLPVETSPASIVGVAAVVNAYLDDRSADVRGQRGDLADATEGSISAEMFSRYRRAGRLVVGVLGRGRAAESLTPADWSKVRNRLKADYSPQTMANYVNAIKSMFTWAYEDAGLLKSAPRFGTGFKVKGLGRALRQSRRDGRRKMFDRDQIHAILDAADPPLRAWALLGINCAFGAADCADLEHGDIDRDGMVITFTRLKTMSSRVCPLWPETLAAIDAAAKVRTKPADPAHADKVFLTPKGWPLVAIGRAVRDGKGLLTSATHYDRCFEALRDTMKAAGIPRGRGVGFSAFRHSFYTQARKTKDYDAVNVIMGHAPEGMVEHYLEEHDLAALRAVDDHVHRWLWPDATD